MKFGIPLLLSILLLVSPCFAQDDWATVQGQICLDDDRRTPIEGALVWLVRNGESNPIHPCMESLRNCPLRLKIIDNKIGAKSILIMTKQKLHVTNNDNVTRGFVPITFGNEGSSSIGAGETQIYEFRNPDKIPGRFANVMDFDNSIPILILDHPYMAQTDERGKFSLDLLPTGQAKLRFWHPEHGFLEGLDSKSLSTNRRGIGSITLNSDIELDLRLMPQKIKNAR